MSSPASLPSEFPRERTWLLPALQTAQRAEGWLSPDTLEAIAAHLRVPKSEVWGVASHYPELRLARPGRRIVRVCTGVSCRVRGGREVLAACERTLGVGACSLAVGAAGTLDALREQVARRRLPFTVVAAGCNGMCWAAPAVSLVRDGQPPLVTGPVTAGDVARLLDALAADTQAAP